MGVINKAVEAMGCWSELVDVAFGLKKLPTIPAVPLEPLCELIAEANYVVPCRICEYRDTYDCEIFPCPSTAEDWRNALTKWMEEQHD